MTNVTPALRFILGIGVISLALAPAQVAGADPITLRPGQKQLLLDDHIVEELSGLERTMHQPRKRGQVLKAEHYCPADKRWAACNWL